VPGQSLAPAGFLREPRPTLVARPRGRPPDGPSNQADITGPTSSRHFPSGTLGDARGNAQGLSHVVLFGRSADVCMATFPLVGEADFVDEPRCIRKSAWIRTTTSMVCSFGSSVLTRMQCFGHFYGDRVTPQWTVAIDLDRSCLSWTAPPPPLFRPARGTQQDYDGTIDHDRLKRSGQRRAVQMTGRDRELHRRRSQQG
jgi:hypothetical protein